MQNIHYPELLPLAMEGDSDDEGTDSGYEWPSAALDHGRAMQMAIEHREERQKFVAEWVIRVVLIVFVCISEASFLVP